MKFTTARLCGGKALMAISAEEMDIDVLAAAERFESEGLTVTEKDEMMCVFQWNGMETTLYRQGKVMFFPLEDKQLCIRGDVVHHDVVHVGDDDLPGTGVLA